MIFGFEVVKISVIPLALLIMLLISVIFIGLGLAFATRMKDAHGFQLIVNFVVFPVYFLSGALYPLSDLPLIIKYLSYIDPLTFGVDALRSSLIHVSAFSIYLDILVLIAWAVVMVSLSSYLFEKTDSV